MFVNAGSLGGRTAVVVHIEHEEGGFLVVVLVLENVGRFGEYIVLAVVVHEGKFPGSLVFVNET